MGKCALNPYSTRINKVAQQYLKLQINSTYNCKVKHYPDGTQNLCFASSDIFGRDERNFSLKSSAYDGFKECTNIYHIINDLDFMDYEFNKTKHSIEVFYKSVDNYLLFQKESRKYDSILDHDSLVWGGNSLSVSEREWLNSLRNSIRQDNLKKTKDTIFDLVMCNEWEYFFTGTIDPKKYDSTNAHKLKPKLKKWFENMVQHYGISYIVIFEYHKRGGIHIHGLIKSSPVTPLRLKDSGTKTYYGFKKPMRDNTALKHGLNPDRGHVVYNLASWRFGWSTAIKVYGSQGALSNYITKYITKSNQKIMGRYFWHSRDLQRPNIFFMTTDYDKLQLPKYHGFKYLYEPSTNDLYKEYMDITTSEDNQEENIDFGGWVDI